MRVEVKFKKVRFKGFVYSYTAHNLDEQIVINGVIVDGEHEYMGPFTFARHLGGKWEDVHHPKDQGKCTITLLGRRRL